MHPSSLTAMNRTSRALTVAMIGLAVSGCTQPPTPSDHVVGTWEISNGFGSPAVEGVLVIPSEPSSGARFEWIPASGNRSTGTVTYTRHGDDWIDLVFPSGSDDDEAWVGHQKWHTTFSGSWQSVQICTNYGSILPDGNEFCTSKVAARQH
jgi:hypothetical protein